MRRDSNADASAMMSPVTRLMPVPAVNCASRFIDASGPCLLYTSSTGGTAFAVGTGGEILRYNGSAWTKLTSGSSEVLMSVSGTSTSNVAAVGTFGTILRFDGTQWTRVAAGSATGDLFGIVGSSANGGRMYLATDDGLLQLNGSSVTPMSTPYAPRLFAVALDGAGNLVAGGQRGLVMRTPGSSWETLNASPDLIDVWTTSANRCV